jgi:hypothetical protein
MTRFRSTLKWANIAQERSLEGESGCELTTVGDCGYVVGGGLLSIYSLH